MAWYQARVPSWRQGTDSILWFANLFVVLYCEDIIRPESLREKDRVGKVCFVFYHVVFPVIYRSLGLVEEFILHRHHPSEFYQLYFSEVFKYLIWIDQMTTLTTNAAPLSKRSCWTRSLLGKDARSHRTMWLLLHLPKATIQWVLYFVHNRT